MKKGILLGVIILSFVAFFLSGLNFSDRFNNFIFSNVLNPYNPLQIPESIKVKSRTGEYWKDPRGLFPIFAYNVPDKTNDLSTSLKIIEKGGINILINANLGWMPYPHKVQEAFKKLENSNLMWISIIETECKDNFIYKNSDDKTNSQIRDYLKAFNDNFVYGWYVWDEPGGNRKRCSVFDLIPNNDNADINRMVKQIRSDSSFNKKLDFVNLFPTYWDGTPDVAAYEKYIDGFIYSQEFKPRVLSFDHYPLLKSERGGYRKDFYSNLAVIQKKSMEYNIPFWMIVLSSGHGNYKNPTFEEISLQVYSALAYGAKGIGYYLYSKSWEKAGYKSWVLEDFVDDSNVADSLHGPLFLPVKKLNAQIQALGKTLLNLEPIEVIHSSDYPNNQKDISESVFKLGEPHSFIQYISGASVLNSDPRILIGILKERKPNLSEGIYLLIVNKDVTTDTFVSILMPTELKIFKYNKITGMKIFERQSNTISIYISAGSGELYYVE